MDSNRRNNKITIIIFLSQLPLVSFFRQGPAALHVQGAVATRFKNTDLPYFLG